MEWSSTFTEFPVLETERCILRKIELNDALSLYEYFSRDEVTKYYDLGTLASKQQSVELVQDLLQCYMAGKQIRWGVALKESNNIIGTCGFHSLELDHFKAELGYDLHPDYWGIGIMTESVARVVEYGFEEMNLNRIEAFYEPLNIASKKVLVKNGFKYEGLLKNKFFIKGRFVDVELSALLKDEYFSI